MPSPDVLISEVGPREGLQSVSRTMPTAAKLAWVSALHAAGLREIEVASFVPATLLPQMAEVRCVVAWRNELSTAFGCTIPGSVADDEVVWLAEQAMAAGVDEAGLPAERLHGMTPEAGLPLGFMQRPVHV